nr:ABC transporter permease [Bacilli bacterium]
MLHNLKYTLKTLFRTRALIFWTFAFPIILGLFFNMAFSNIESDEQMKIFEIAIVDNQEYRENIIYKNVLDNLNGEVFDAKYVSEEEAKNLLEERQIYGYLYFEDDTPEIYVRKSGIYQTILKFIVEEVEQRKSIFSNVALKEGYNFNNVAADIMAKLDSDVLSLNNKSNSNLSYTVIEFYTLIAMAAMYGGTIGLSAITTSLANMGEVGKRSSITPTKKSVMVISKTLASYIVALCGIAILMLFLYFVLHVDFGDKILYVILLAMVGTLAGNALGILVASLFKCSYDAKIGIIIAITMFLSVLSGMMGITLKYVVDTNLPFVNMINPCNMITDGFYALYYYTTLNRFWFDIVSLLLFTMLCLTISSISIRREKYDSI